MNVTLGSLLNESLEQLEALNIIPDTNEEEDGLVTGGDINVESHVPTNEEKEGGVDAGPDATERSRQLSSQSALSMQNRGMPYFEEMVENSRLGRIKRQRGGQTSQDGRTVVQWEVLEIGGEDPAEEMLIDPPLDEKRPSDTGGGGSSNKKQKLGA